MIIDTKDLDRGQIYKLLTSIIVPRPIAWVSTVSKDGVYNLAPFSYFAGVSSEPPVLMISVGRKENGEKKDTWKNIEETGDFVVNIVTKELAEKMNTTSAPFEEHIDEFEKAGLTPQKAQVVKSPLVKEAPINLECEKYQITNIGNMGVIFGKVLKVHIKDYILNEKGYVDTNKLSIVGRLGGANYCLITPENSFEMRKPKL